MTDTESPEQETRLPRGAASAPGNSVLARAALLPGAAFDAGALAVHSSSAATLAGASPRLAQSAVVLGVASDGAPVTLRPVHQDRTHVRAALRPHTACQLTFRAAAAGHRVAIATMRPQMWEPLVRHFSSDGRVVLAGTSRPAWAGPLIAVEDGVPHPERETAPCVVTLSSPGHDLGPAPQGGTVIDVEERVDVAGTAVITYAGRRTEVGLFRRPEEDSLFGHL